MTRAEETQRRQTDAVRLFQDAVEAALRSALRQPEGFAKTLKFAKALKSKKSGVLPPGGMMTVEEGVLEENPYGLYDAALHTDQGRVVLRNAQRTDRSSSDPQLIAPLSIGEQSGSADGTDFTPERLLSVLASEPASQSPGLICAIELVRFDSSQRDILLPLLWRYILDHRDSNNRPELVATGAAIRKYIAIMPMDRMGDLAVLLESGHRSTLPIELEIEVAKMILRNFEVHPPLTTGLLPELGQRLWEIAQAYINPRLLLRDKNAAATSCAIEAIVAMRSPLAERAWRAAIACPYRWFAELVSDDLDELMQKWASNCPSAAEWLLELRNRVAAQELSA